MACEQSDVLDLNNTDNLSENSNLKDCLFNITNNTKLLKNNTILLRPKTS